MGMAASQARFLGLTARKTNTEYEGQQVNQQRTALANQSAGLFNKMLALEVPAPPSTSDFYYSKYTFSSGDRNFEIMSGLGSDTAVIMEAKPANTIRIQPAFSGEECLISFNAITGAPSLNGRPLTKLTSRNNIGEELNVSVAQLEKILKANTKVDPPFMSAGDTPIYSWEDYIAAGSSFSMTNKNNILYSYSNGGVQTYIQSSYIYQQGREPEHPDNEDFGGIKIDQEFYDHSYTQYDEVTYSYCKWTKDGSGRYVQMQGVRNGDTQAVTVDLKFEQVKDDMAYDDAMNAYVYKKEQYEQEVARINAETEMIQQHDRTLELRLKQLDTEQKALQTEMDAVKKVIDKNVETTFKTFA